METLKKDISLTSQSNHLTNLESQSLQEGLLFGNYEQLNNKLDKHDCDSVETFKIGSEHSNLALNESNNIEEKPNFLELESQVCEVNGKMGFCNLEHESLVKDRNEESIKLKNSCNLVNLNGNTNLEDQALKTKEWLIKYESVNL